jgi:hypothetical protein
MCLKKLILGLLLLPFVLVILIILIPFILFFGILSVIFQRPMGTRFVNTATFRWQGAAPQPPRDDDVIDVDVIRSENTGEQNDISGRTLR